MWNLKSHIMFFKLDIEECEKSFQLLLCPYILNWSWTSIALRKQEIVGKHGELMYFSFIKS
jgi:hypothetical protein